MAILTVDDTRARSETSLPPFWDGGQPPGEMSAGERERWKLHTHLRQLVVAEAEAWKRFARGAGLSVHASPRSRERRVLWWACGWLSALSVAWAGHAVFSRIVEKRTAEFSVIADGDYLPDLERHVLETDPWLDASRICVVLFAIGFLSCLTWWLLEIRKRRMQAE